MATVTVNRTSQRFYSTPQPEADVTVIHTTEGMSWPGYNGGGSAPHATIRAIPGKGIEVREHIDFSKYAKALMNLPGGVETNRRGVLQFELIGTCDEKHKGSSSWYFWPDADDVVLQALADYLRPIHTKYGIPAKAPSFKAYRPGGKSTSGGSYGRSNGVRMSGAEWIKFQGICGHQHVPENDHGDPGNFPIAKLLKFLGGSTSKPQSGRPFLTEDGVMDVGTIKAIQTFVGASRTGVMDKPTIKRLQNWAGVTQDGVIGPITTRAVQKRISAPQTGSWNLRSKSDPTTRAFEAYLNRGTRRRLAAQG